MNLDPKKTVFLIDGSSFLYRAYYGVRPLHTATGIPVQAVYSFCRMIKKIVDTFHFQYGAIVWDSRGKTTRHAMYESYKATRQAPPNDIFEQKVLIQEFADLIGMKQVATQGIEADDIMYSLALEQKNAGNTVVLITSDKDMGQAIEGQQILMFDPWKDVLYDQEGFEKKMGLPIAKLPFYYALLGDASDNIPGVHGIGDKGAQSLVNQFASIEDMYARLDMVAKERTRTILAAQKENAYLSYNLFLLQYQPTQLTMADLSFDAAAWIKARPLFTRLDFKSLLKDIDALENVQRGVRPDVAHKMTEYDFITIVDREQLENLAKLLQQKKLFAIDTETANHDVLSGSCVGLSLCVQEGTAYYVPFAHKNVERQLSLYDVKAVLGPIFADPEYKKIFHHAKFDLEALHGVGMEVNGIIFDTLLAASLLKTDYQRAGLKHLSERYFNEPMLTFEEVVKANNYKNFSYVPFELATRYAAADAHQTFRLKPILEKELKQENLFDLFTKIEFPTMQILYAMELEGITIDVPFLAQLGARIDADLQQLIAQIGMLAVIEMSEININSPRQVEHLLFTHLLLPTQKKSAKGTSYSTDQEVLETLSKMHPVPGLIMKYRELYKLKTTYVEALPTYVSKIDNKIHTTFNQTIVATGRLASSDPNLQNIPTDSQGYGIEVRAAFVAPEGHVFLSADYSQIELRILAHLSGDANLINAFLAHKDIHAELAAALFDLPEHEVTSAQRQIGKRINFSVLYGMTPYGLSQDLGIMFSQAKEYIEKYFAKYPGVLAWMEQVVIDTKHKGYVTTYWGRRRYVPAIYEKNRALYEEARRVAINTVPQGTAAEIMKQGMIRLNEAFKREGLSAKMILQIHDELLISVPIEQRERTEQLVIEVLESIVQWRVPLKVNTRFGKNWKEVTK